MKIKKFIPAALLIFCACHSRGQNEGMLIRHSYFFSKGSLANKPSLDISKKIFFKDNLSIQQVPLLVFTDDSSGKKTEVKVKYYSYLNRDKNVCYNYGNFSDTAKILEFYPDIDSALKLGGWNFYSKEKYEYDSMFNLNDTVIKNKTYKRIRIDERFNNMDTRMIIYFACDKKDLTFSLNRPLSDSIGCPIVRDDTFIDNKLFMTTELEFVSDKLSPAELQVFNTWQANESKPWLRPKTRKQKSKVRRDRRNI